MLGTIVKQEVIVKEFVTCDYLRGFRTITIYGHLVVECDDAQLSLRSALGHLANLVIDSGLNALHARNVGHVARLALHFLVRTIREFHEVSQGPGLVSLDGVLALDLLRHAH